MLYETIKLVELLAQQRYHIILEMQTNYLEIDSLLIVFYVFVAYYIKFLKSQLSASPISFFIS